MFIDQIIDLQTASDESWDAVIVGAGMGGSACAYSLAKSGYRVLILEKGANQISRSTSTSIVSEQEDPAERLASGRWPTKMRVKIDESASDIWPVMGCGTGGSTLLYAATLQRLEPKNFAPQKLPDGRILEWPYSYDDLAPFYSEVEKLFRVRGSKNPLSEVENSDLLPPPAMCPADQNLFHHFQASGLNPYRLHVGMEYTESCKECGDRICETACKRDAVNSLLIPALETGNLFIANNAEVSQLISKGQKIDSVLVRNGNQDFSIKSRCFVVAAGSLFTPALLMRSKNADWPEGLANSSDQLGRNLMFHGSKYMAFWPDGKHSRDGPRKNIAIRDFYYHEGVSLGELQSTGLGAGYGNILYSLRLMFDQSRLKYIPFLRQFLRIPAWVASKFLGEATVFDVIVEDFPYEDNKVVQDDSSPSGIRVEYQIRPELRQRVQSLAKLIVGKVNLRSIMLTIGIGLNYGHPCGSCRAGLDPKTSVLNSDCQTHDIENLFVTDGSFMPTSGGTNPSLTIAANALRVGEKIAQRLN